MIFARITTPALISLLLFTLFPFSAFAQSTAFRSQGLFSCNPTNANAMSVGTLSAIGGVYVPVNDAAVTVNTGILIYKECILREVVDAERMAAASAIDANVQRAVVNGANGRGFFPKKLRVDTLTLASDPKAVDFINNKLDNLPEKLKSPIQHALGLNYLFETRDRESKYTCPYKGDLAAALSGQDSSPEAVMATFDPRCDPLFAYFAVKEARDEVTGDCIDEMMTRLKWNEGFYDVTANNKVCDDEVLSPGTLIRDTTSAAVQSGMNQLRAANDLGQMTGALYAGLAAQIVTDPRGLSGTVTGIGGQPSYLDQIVAEQAANVRNAAGNAALVGLIGARTIEMNLLQIATNIVNILTQTTQQLRSMENQCWGFIIQKVCTGTPDANNRCTSTTGVQLRIATSTAYSQAVIDAQIKPLTGVATNNVTNAQQSVNLINGLIAGVQNTNSQEAQRLAIVQYDALVVSGKLHKKEDVTNAASQQQSLQDTMNKLINDTKTTWADGTDPNVAWCNVNQQSVLDKWIQAWKQ